MTLSATQATSASYASSHSTSKAKTRNKADVSFAKLREFQAARAAEGAKKTGATFKNDHETPQPVQDGTSGTSNGGDHEVPSLVGATFRNDHETPTPTSDPTPGASFKNDLRKLADASPESSTKFEEAAKLDASYSMKNGAIASLMADRAMVA